MSLVLMTPPAELPLSLAELKAQCRLDGLDDDASQEALLMGYARAATAWVDGPDGHIQRALISQTWELRLNGFPLLSGMYAPVLSVYPRFVPDRNARAEIVLPLPPLQSVTSITYIDSAGDEQTLDPASYQVAGSHSRMKARIVPASGTVWPFTRDQPEAVTVTFEAGYGDSWNDVPEPIRQALMLLVAYWFNQREGALIDPVIVEVPFGVRELLRSYRVDLSMA